MALSGELRDVDGEVVDALLRGETGVGNDFDVVGRVDVDVAGDGSVAAKNEPRIQLEQ